MFVLPSADAPFLARGALAFEGAGAADIRPVVFDARESRIAVGPCVHFQIRRFRQLAHVGLESDPRAVFRAATSSSL